MVEVLTPVVAGTTVVMTVDETGTTELVTAPADTLALDAGQLVTSGAQDVTVNSWVLYTTCVISVVSSVVTAVTFGVGVNTAGVDWTGVSATLTGPVPLTGGLTGVETPPETSEETGADGVISGPSGVETDEGVGTTTGPAGVEGVGTGASGVG